MSGRFNGSTVRWFLILLTLVACGHHEPPTVRRRASPPARAAATPASPLVEPVLTAPHPSAISVLALAAGGDAAVTADLTGALRLWPTLDGTRAPVVLHAQQPRALAVARHAGGYLVAVRDEANGLELIAIDGDGRVRSRTMVAVDTRDVVLGAGEAIVLDADQTITVLDVRGAVLARLVPDPGTRVERLVAAGDDVLAITSEAGRRTIGRWIHARAWGSSLALPLELGAPIVVSPDRRWIAGIHGGRGTLVDATKLTTRGACTTPDTTLHVTPIGFVDATTLACVANGHLVWWSTTEAAVVATDTSEPMLDVDRDRAAAGIVVQAAHNDLVLRRREGAQRLGYRGRPGVDARFSPSGLAITPGRVGETAYVIDGALRMQATVMLAAADAALVLDEHALLALSPRQASASDVWGGARSLSVIDAVTGAVLQQLPIRASDAVVYEPSTRLLAAIDGVDVNLARYDAATRRFGAPISVAPAETGVVHRIALLDPARADGRVALVIEQRVESVVVSELLARDLAGPTAVPKAAYRVPGQLRAVDTAGRLYLGDDAGGVSVALRAAPPRTLPIRDVLEVLPARDGSRFVVRRAKDLALFTADGAEVWTVPLREALRVGWIGDALIASYGDALARIDLATGAFAQRRCGWEFGLHPDLVPTRLATSSVCDAD